MMNKLPSLLMSQRLGECVPANKRYLKHATGQDWNCQRLKSWDAWEELAMDIYIRQVWNSKKKSLVTESILDCLSAWAVLDYCSWYLVLSPILHGNKHPCFIIWGLAKRLALIEWGWL